MKIDAKSHKFLLTALFLILIFSVRFFSDIPVLVGGESYYSMRISEEIRNNAIISEDPLGEDFQFSILYYLLAPLNELTKSFIPLILGLLGVFFYFKSLNKNYRVISTALLLASPLFLTVFTELNNIMLGTFFVLLNFYNIHKRKIITFTFIQTLLALTNFEIWLVSTIFFIYKNKTYIAAIPGLLLSPFTFDLSFKLSPLFSELGASQGYSLFLFMLALIGFIWRKKNPLRAILLSLGFILSIYLPDIRILGTLIIVPYASRALMKLVARKWELPHIKQATIFLIALVLAFSAIAKTGELTKAEPVDLSTFKELANLEEGTVLSTQDLGHYIQYYSRMPVILDSKSSKNEVLITEELLKSQNVDYVLSQLSSLDVKYLILPETEDRKGIYFVSDNSPNLRLISSGSYELWTFTS